MKPEQPATSIGATFYSFGWQMREIAKTQNDSFFIERSLFFVVLSSIFFLMTKRLFTSESVTEWHPDKVCDQISDSILDAILTQDPLARVAVETTISDGFLALCGEVTTTAKIDYETLAKETIQSIGYISKESGFNPENAKILINIHTQSPDIAQWVNAAYEDEKEIGAWDQGMVFGYACDETPELLPLPISLAHTLAKKLTQARKNKILPYLLPDGKTQVTIEYENNIPVRIDTIVISTQHTETIELNLLRKDILEKIIQPVVSGKLFDEKTKIFINPTGRFVTWGPKGDTGLTGRKIIVDTYGWYARHGGWAFSGKDPTKVDRSAAYAARYVAKNIVAAGLARKCEVQIAYAIGVARPISILVDTFGTNTTSEEFISEAVNNIFDLRPRGIIEMLELQKPQYKPLASYGHFWREELDVKWEKTDKIEALKKFVSEEK